jgi:radical SAM protein with 4Fe4S-binding SPASM domain
MLMPCVTNAGIRLPLGKAPLAEAWEALKKQVSALPLPADCPACPDQAVCNACPATVYNETGDYRALSDYTCAYVRAQAEARLAYLRQRGEGR